jgi:hypothetical protein
VYPTSNLSPLVRTRLFLALYLSGIMSELLCEQCCFAIALFYVIIKNNHTVIDYYILMKIEDTLELNLRRRKKYSTINHQLIHMLPRAVPPRESMMSVIERKVNPSHSVHTILAEFNEYASESLSTFPAHLSE